MTRTLMLAVAILYPVAAIAGFSITIHTDNFAIFHDPYQAFWLVVLPLALAALAVVLAFRNGAPRRVWSVALLLWVGLVTWGHNGLIAIAAGGV